MALIPPVITIGNDAYIEPERILVYGIHGSGKTNMWLQIAAASDPDVTFHTIDTDNGVVRSMSRDFAHLTNVSVTTVQGFYDYVTWAKELDKIIKPGDWIVPDMASTAYNAAADFYLQRKYGKTRQEIEFEHEMEKMLNAEVKAGAPAIAPDDWVMIRNLFLNWWEGMVVKGLSVKHGAHIFATAEAKQVMEHYEAKNPDQTILRDYKDLKFKPDGHKSLAHRVHTVAMTNRTGNGTETDNFWFIPVKDRQRDMSNLIVGNFVDDYLVGRAGWSRA